MVMAGSLGGYRYTPARKGRAHEASFAWGRVVVPAGEARNLALGRPRSPARVALGPLCEELAGRAGAFAGSRKRGPGSSQVLRDPASRDGAP